MERFFRIYPEINVDQDIDLTGYHIIPINIPSVKVYLGWTNNPRFQEQARDIIEIGIITRILFGKPMLLCRGFQMPFDINRLLKDAMIGPAHEYSIEYWPLVCRLTNNELSYLDNPTIIHKQVHDNIQLQTNITWMIDYCFESLINGQRFPVTDRYERELFFAQPEVKELVQVLSNKPNTTPYLEYVISEIDRLYQVKPIYRTDSVLVYRDQLSYEAQIDLNDILSRIAPNKYYRFKHRRMNDYKPQVDQDEVDRIAEHRRFIAEQERIAKTWYLDKLNRV